MSVMTPARTQNHTADYHQLTPLMRAEFDRVMQIADNTIDATEFNSLMASAAYAAGMPLPASGAIVRCACPHCWACGSIFDTDAPGLIEVEPTAYNLPRLQCPTCVDEHPVDPEQ
ncbi:hypothetical protein [Streptomyces sp. NPDC006551]|uniref:hypothetical protein n=1 Tax=Streptomyces sp. NPDC006551 TaxID=3157178 RepID=UPI00339EB684